jgi:hypothetical protein
MIVENHEGRHCAPQDVDCLFTLGDRRSPRRTRDFAHPQDPNLHRCTVARKTVENLPLRATFWSARHDGECPRLAWQAVSRSRLAALSISGRASEEPTGIGRREAATNGPGDVHYLAPNAAARCDDALTPISRLCCQAIRASPKVESSSGQQNGNETIGQIKPNLRM